MSKKMYNGILIDYGRDSLIPEQGLAMMTKSGFYKKEHEESPQESFARMVTCFSFGDYELAQRLYDARSLNWFTGASPVQSTAMDVEWPKFTEEQFEEAGDWLEKNVKATDGLPISCFLSLVSDDKESLLRTSDECRRLSMSGGGLGVKFGNRSPDEKSTGVLAHLKGYDADALAYKQSKSRRGSIGAYLDIDHPEILNFMEVRNPVGGEVIKKCFNINNGVMITDSFMEAMIKGEDYPLVDPKHGLTGTKLNARKVWYNLMELRKDTGEPFIAFVDTINRNLPSQIMNPTYRCIQSNLCSEITLMTSKKRTAVCCLSSVNLATYEEWKDTTLIADLTRFLDNVLEYFIRLAPKELSRAVYSAKKERALGLGTLGWHSYLQSKMIPLESGGFDSAVHHTHQIFGGIKQQAVTESKRLAVLRGEAPDCVGSGFRNSHLMALAPNASTADLVGASPTTEPYDSNAYLAQGRAGSFSKKNPYLTKLLEEKGKNTTEVWKSIISNDGSVQHLQFLTEEEKKVFKTAREIDPTWLVELCAARQEHVCQAQSFNIWCRKGITAQQMSDIHVLGWMKGIKTFYYARGEDTTKASVGDGGKEPLNAVPVDFKVEFNDCLSCDG